MSEAAQQRAPITLFKGDFDKLARTESLFRSEAEAREFKNVIVAYLGDNPDILKCDRASVFQGIRRAIDDGLKLDGREAALVKYGTKAQYMPMVFGIIQRIRRSGAVKAIRARVVYQQEIDQGRFEVIYGDDERIVHRPIVFGARGEPVAVYAIAELENGAVERDVMTSEEIEKVRAKGGAVWKGPFRDEMWKKSPIRRLAKRLPLSSSDLSVIMREDSAADDARDITPEAATAPRQSAMENALTPIPDTEAEDAVEVLEPTQEQAQEAYDAGMASFSDLEAACPHDPETDLGKAWLAGREAAEAKANGSAA